MEEITKRITKEQKYMLVQYLEEHKEFAHDRFLNSSGLNSLAEQWESLAEKLNALGGANKTGENWKKAWTNMRSKTKQKFQDYKNSLDRSGVNGAQQHHLTDLDQRIIGVMRKESVVGQEEVAEPLRVAGRVADVSILAECDDLGPSKSFIGENKSCESSQFQRKKRKESDTGKDMLELERQILKEKRRKNDILEQQVKALSAINETLLNILKTRQQ